MTKRKPRRSERSQRSSSTTITFDSALQLHVKGRMIEAESAYRELIAAGPADSRLFHLLGRLLHQQGRCDESIQSIRSALATSPDDSEATNDLALILQETGELDESATCFRRLIEIDPDNAQAWNNLGIVLKGQDHLQDAIAAFKEATRLDPMNTDSRCNLGNVYKLKGDLPESETAYRKALSIDPSLLDVYPNLAAVLRRRGRLDQAVDIFNRWLEHEPDNPIARHLKATCESESTPSRASAGYIREVFDEFAETYDEHLQDLDNRGPQLIIQALHDECLEPTTTLDILDAGCGSGLCGGLLKPFARTLVGVDLSSRMLERADQSGLYDELVEADLVKFLESRQSSFDLIVVADTFGYFGDLQPVFDAIQHALRAQGLLICTIEIDGEATDHTTGYRLMNNGRYCHTGDYLEKSLAANNLVVSHLISGVLRREATQPVCCVVVNARRLT